MLVLMFKAGIYIDAEAETKFLTSVHREAEANWAWLLMSVRIIMRSVEKQTTVLLTVAPYFDCDWPSSESNASFHEVEARCLLQPGFSFCFNLNGF
jgi:hypothetical protein